MDVCGKKEETYPSSDLLSIFHGIFHVFLLAFALLLFVLNLIEPFEDLFLISAEITSKKFVTAQPPALT